MKSAKLQSAKLAFLWKNQVSWLNQTELEAAKLNLWLTHATPCNLRTKRSVVSDPYARLRNPHCGCHATIRMDFLKVNLLKSTSV